MLSKLLYLNGILLVAQTTLATPLPLRELQNRAIEPTRDKPATTTCEEGDEECVEEPIPAVEVEDEGLTDATIIAIVIGSVLGLIALLTAVIVVYQVMKHK